MLIMGIPKSDFSGLYRTPFENAIARVVTRGRGGVSEAEVIVTDVTANSSVYLSSFSISSHHEFEDEFEDEDENEGMDRILNFLCCLFCSPPLSVFSLRYFFSEHF